MPKIKQDLLDRILWYNKQRWPRSYKPQFFEIRDHIQKTLNVSERTAHRYLIENSEQLLIYPIAVRLLKMFVEADDTLENAFLDDIIEK